MGDGRKTTIFSSPTHTPKSSRERSGTLGARVAGEEWAGGPEQIFQGKEGRRVRAHATEPGWKVASGFGILRAACGAAVVFPEFLPSYFRIPGSPLWRQAVAAGSECVRPSRPRGNWVRFQSEVAPFSGKVLFQAQFAIWVYRVMFTQPSYVEFGCARVAGGTPRSAEKKKLLLPSAQS